MCACKVKWENLKDSFSLLIFYLMCPSQRTLKTPYPRAPFLMGVSVLLVLSLHLLRTTVVAGASEVSKMSHMCYIPLCLLLSCVLTGGYFAALIYTNRT